MARAAAASKRCDGLPGGGGAGMALPMRAAIIGAGVAGLAAARRLADAGAAVTLFDKGRGPGGRLSTRRWDAAGVPVRADMGAQYATARGAGFRAAMDALVAAGHVAEWRPQLADSGVPAEPWFAGVGGMNAMVKGLAEGLPKGVGARFGVQVAAPARDGDGWALADATGARLGWFDLVVIATPAEQATALLAGAPALARASAAASSAPCWAAALRFDGAPDPGFDAGRFDADAAWVVRLGSRPGQPEQGVWIVHASAEWSRAHLELTPDDVAPRLTAGFARATGISAAPVAAIAHRWRYALVERPASAPFGWDAAARVGSCGDWHGAARIEAAWASGDALGAAVARSLAG